MTVLDTMLALDISQTNIIKARIDWEVYQYILVNINENGEGEVEDRCNELVFEVNVPSIEFLEYIELLRYLKARNIEYSRYFTKELKPLEMDDDSRDIWIYFDSREKNLLYRSSKHNQINALYYIKEFEYYAVLRLTKSMNKCKKRVSGINT